MIKCDKNRIEIKGTPVILVGELGTAIQTVYRAMLNTGIDKVFAEERIKKACELALLTDKEQEEVSKDLDRKIDEKLDKLANAILKELFEGGSNDRDCIMANLEQRDCKGLKELYCAKEDKPCPFYKPADKYNRDGSRRRKANEKTYK